MDVYGYDPLLSDDQIEGFGVKTVDNLNIRMDCVIVVVAHDRFRKMSLDDIGSFMNESPVLIDVRGIFNGEIAVRAGYYYQRV